MTDFAAHYLAEASFFRLVETGDLSPNASLELVSKMPSSPGPYATDMIRGFEEAWRTPFWQLTCEQVRLLLGQRAGLEWRGRPLLEFVQRFPEATVSNWPGEMALLSLKAAPEFADAVGSQYAAWVMGDFGWLDEVFGWSRPLLIEAHAALELARPVVAQR